MKNCCGAVVNRCDLQYTDARLGYNRAYDKYPLEIIFCYSDRDVMCAINYVCCNNLKFRIRSGRHDAEGISNIDCGVVIDISNINYVMKDIPNERVKVGGGILSGKVYDELVKDNYTLASGTCAGVGLSSLTSVGGFGFTSRYFGLACDNLVEVELVNYCGELITANKYNNSELFWALRGGLESNFGVVVSLTYKIYPVSYASTFVLDWNIDDFINAFNVWQYFSPYADNRLSTTFVLAKSRTGSLTVRCSGQFFGTVEELEYEITPLLETNPESVELLELPYSQVLNKWSSGCSAPDYYKSSSSFIYDQLSLDNIEFLRESVLSIPLGNQGLLEFLDTTGKVNNVGTRDTAFVHRKALFFSQIKSRWYDDSGASISRKWVEYNKKMFDIFGKGAYRGFTDLNIINWQEQYYGINYPRLQYVKSIYDPYNFFSFPQSIRI